LPCIGIHDPEGLVKRAQDGDEQAISRLITIHKGLVYTIVFRMVNDADVSQDLTQETFIKAFMNIKKVKNYKHYKAWVCKIAKNLVYDYFRKMKRRKTVSLEEVGDIQGDADVKKIRKQAIIQDALARLKERDRMLLTLSYFDGFSIADVADTLNMSENNVKVCLHRARHRLRKQLKGFENELLSAN
jgi:RNA polymerase sigma-70 factor (ECF subfamily)